MQERPKLARRVGFEPHFWQIVAEPTVETGPDFLEVFVRRPSSSLSDRVGVLASQPGLEEFLILVFAIAMQALDGFSPEAVRSLPILRFFKAREHVALEHLRRGQV